MRKSSVSTPRRVRCDVANAMVPSSIQGNRRASRNSISSVLSRCSSIQDNKKETRPMNDRHGLQKNLKSLATFLTDNNYMHLGVPYSLQKVLNSPSIRDVTSIFQFLISLINIDYPREKKFEDEFSRIMKLLLYPYAISKRQLQHIGSMHNWPSIVHALSWLCNLNKISKAIDDDPLDFPRDGEEDMLKYLEFQVDMEAYNDFLRGEDDHAQLDKDFCDKLPTLIGMDEVKELDEQMMMLSEKKEELERLKDVFHSTQQQNVLLITDNKKLISYVHELEEFVNKMEARVYSLTGEGEELKNELDIMKAEVVEKENIIARQRITVQEVQALEIIVENLKSQLVESEEVLSKVQAEVVTSDAALLKEKDELHAIIEEYHGIARDCSLIPDSACNAQGYNYSIQLPKPESETSPSNVDDILRRLKLILKQWKESSRELRAQEIKAVEDIQQLQDIYTSKVEEVGFMEAKIRRQQEAINVVKQDYANEIHELREETAALEEEIVKLNLRDKGSYDIEALQKTNKELQMEVVQLEEKVRRVELTVKEFLFNFCEIIIDHKNAVEERVFRFQHFITQWCNERDRDKISFGYQKIREELKIDEMKIQVDRMVEACFSLNLI